MIDWLNLIAGIILGGAGSSLIFWFEYGKKLDELSKTFKAFSKYGTNIPPTYCQFCNKEVQFSLAWQSVSNERIINHYQCPLCGKNTSQIVKP